MSFLLGALFLGLVPFVAGFGFFGARYVAARAFGVRGGAAEVSVALDAAPWEHVSRARRLLFGAVGPVGWYLMASLLFALGLLAAGRAVPDNASMRVMVDPAGPAATAGVRDGDRIVRVGSVDVRDWASLKEQVRSHANEDAVPIVVERAGAQLTVSPAIDALGRIRVGPYVEWRSVGVGEAIAFGLREPATIVGETIATIVRMIGGTEKAEFTGPVGIAKEGGKTATGARPLQWIAALTSYFWPGSLLLAIAFFPRLRRRPV
jgi:regulator of sigma E protease